MTNEMRKVPMTNESMTNAFDRPLTVIWETVRRTALVIGSLVIVSFHAHWSLCHSLRDFFQDRLGDVDRPVGFELDGQGQGIAGPTVDFREFSVPANA